MNTNLENSARLVIEAAQAFIEGGEGEELYQACENFKWHWQEQDPDYQAYVERQADLFTNHYEWEDVA